MVSVRPGDSLGRHEVAEEIGRGAMAVVYRAHDPVLNRDVAIKVLPPSLAQDPAYVERFTREAQSVARLNHPNILRVHDFGEEGGLTYIVTEFVPGGTLREALQGRLWAPGDTVQLMLTLAEALDYAHFQGVLHRDVKPSNVFLDAEAAPVLGDFGVATIMKESRTVTATGHVLGTPEYMAPEQALGHKTDFPADLYSLGVVMYEMLVGETPFHADTATATLLAHISEPLRPPSEVNSDLDPATDLVLQKALAKSPDERFGTAGELVNSLASIVRGASTRAPRKVVSPPASPTDTEIRHESKVRVMIVDDHDVVRSGLAGILGDEKDLEVVGEADSGERAVREVGALRPNVILMDIRMEGMDGITACRLIKSDHPDIAVLMFTSYGDDEDVMSAIVAGASGYLIKNVSGIELLRAIRVVASGQSLLDPAVTKRVMERLADLASGREPGPPEALSEEGRAVLELVAHGLTNREVAAELDIGEGAAGQLVGELLEKLGLARRSEAADYAAEHGLLDPNKTRHQSQ